MSLGRRVRYPPRSTDVVPSSHYHSVPGRLPQQSGSSASASANFHRTHSSHARKLLIINSGHHPYRSSQTHHTRLYHEARRPSSAMPNSADQMSSRVHPSGQPIFYLRDHDQVEHIVDKYRQKLLGPLGLDLEHKPNFTKGTPPNKTALVQLASDTIILLVQVSAMLKFPPSIRKLIEDPAIIKAGVGIKGDTEKLWKDFGISASGCLELGNLARAVDTQWATWQGMIGLARLLKVYEDRNFKKPKTIQLSNWELNLTEEQQDYAANDAEAGLKVLKKLLDILPSVSPAPPEGAYLFRMSHGRAKTLAGDPFQSPSVKATAVVKAPPSGWL